LIVPGALDELVKTPLEVEVFVKKDDDGMLDVGIWLGALKAKGAAVERVD
jgi:hypothetical protein